MVRIFLLLILLSTNCFAQDYSWLREGVYKDNSHSTVGLKYHQNNGSANIISVQIDLKNGWKTFWKSPGDAGYPLNINWERSKNVKDVKIIWPAPKRFVDVVGKDLYLEVWGYEDKISIPVEITPEDIDKEGHFNIDLNYSVCKKICIPQKASFKVILPMTPLPESLENIQSKESQYIIPAENGTYGLEIESVHLEKSYLSVHASSRNGFKNPDVFITGISGARFPKPIIETDENKATFKILYEINIKNTNLKGSEVEVTLVDDNFAVFDKVVLEREDVEKSNLPEWIIFLLPVLFGFLGGFILNVMPCVLPVISLKLLTLAKYGGRNTKYIRFSFIASALGIISSFWVFAIITAIFKYVGLAVGWGIHFQQPVFIVILSFVVLLFSANLCGFYQIPLPSWLGSFAIKHGSKGLWGHFMTGVFTTVLATPCSAPFLGTAVGFALSHGVWEIMLIFTSMGIGLSFPFILIAFHPEFVSRLPKPGRWMLKVKFFLGILLALTGLWLVWVLSHQVGNILALTMLSLFSLFILILRFGRSFKIKIFIVAILIITGVATAIFTEKKSFDKMQEDVGFWHPFQEEDIFKHVEEGKVVFVKITADWCLTCKTNKILVLSSKKVRKLLGSDFVVAMQADWTRPNPKITEYLQKNDKFGIPFTIVYSKRYPNGIVLSELLSEREILEVVSKAIPSN